MAALPKPRMAALSPGLSPPAVRIPTRLAIRRLLMRSSGYRRRLHSGSACLDPVPLEGVARVADLARPPERVAQEQSERRHEHRPYDQSVEQDADADDDADLSQSHERQHAEYGEHRGQQDARAGDDPARR